MKVQMKLSALDQRGFSFLSPSLSLSFYLSITLWLLKAKSSRVKKTKVKKSYDLQSIFSLIGVHVS